MLPKRWLLVCSGLMGSAFSKLAIEAKEWVFACGLQATHAQPLQPTPASHLARGARAKSPGMSLHLLISWSRRFRACQKRTAEPEGIRFFGRLLLKPQHARGLGPNSFDHWNLHSPKKAGTVLDMFDSPRISGVRLDVCMCAEP